MLKMTITHPIWFILTAAVGNYGMYWLGRVVEHRSLLRRGLLWRSRELDLNDISEERLEEVNALLDSKRDSRHRAQLERSRLNGDLCGNCGDTYLMHDEAGCHQNTRLEHCNCKAFVPQRT
jgi:hypothetical protein